MMQQDGTAHLSASSSLKNERLPALKFYQPHFKTFQPFQNTEQPHKNAEQRH